MKRHLIFILTFLIFMSWSSAVFSFNTTTGYTGTQVDGFLTSVSGAVNATAGAGDAAKLIKTDASGLVDATFLSGLYSYQTVSVSSMKDGVSPPDALDDASTRTPYQYRTFASDADEDLNFVWFVPADLSGTTIQFRVFYLIVNGTGPTNAEGVAFGLSGVSIGDNDATNAAKGTVVVVTDDALDAAQWDLMVTDWSGAVTVTNLAAGELAELAFIRDVSDAIDDYGQLVGVVAVQIKYAVSQTR